MPSQPFLIDQILEKIDKQQLLSSVQINVSNFSFLQDHEFNGEIIIPAVFLLEILAQNSACLFPSYIIQKISKAEFHSFLKITTTETLYTQLTQINHSQEGITLTGSIYYFFCNEKINLKRKKILATFELILSSHLESAPDTFYFPFNFKGLPIIQKTEIYPGLVGLGHSFRHLEAVFDLSSAGVSGKLKPVSLDIAFNRQQLFLGDFFLRDSAYHLPAVWGIFFTGAFNVPCKFYHYQSFGRLNPLETYYCHAKPLRFSSHESVFQLVIFNAQGQIIEIYGEIHYTHDIVEPHENQRNSIEAMQRSIFSAERFLRALENYIPDSYLIPLELGTILKDFLLPLLTPAEAAILDRYRPESKKYEFLLGRIAIKYSFLKLKNALGVKDFWQQIEITRHETGAPFLKSSLAGSDLFYFSLSHKKEFLFFAASSSQPVGVDLEIISSRLETLKSKFLNSAEEDLINQNQVPGLDKITLLTAVWASKEAIVKKTYSNLMHVFKQYQLIRIEPGQLTLQNLIDKTLVQAHFYILNSYLICYL